MAPETAQILNRVYEIAAAVLDTMPDDDRTAWGRWGIEHGFDITMRIDGELVDILLGGGLLALVPKRILAEPDETTFSVLGALPTVPDDARELTGP